MITRKCSAHSKVKPELTEALDSIYESFHLFNKRYFDSKLQEPEILLQPESEMIYHEVHALGGALTNGALVVILDEVFTYTLDHRNYRFGQGILLHEMIHLSGIGNHGLLFARECNRITKAITVFEPPVTVANCQTWNVMTRLCDTFEDKKFIAEQIEKSELWEKKSSVLNQVKTLKLRIDHIKSKSTKLEFGELEKIIDQYFEWESSRRKGTTR